MWSGLCADNTAKASKTARETDLLPTGEKFLVTALVPGNSAGLGIRSYNDLVQAGVWAQPCIGDWEGWRWTACWERPLHESKIRLSTNFFLPEVCLSTHHHFVRKPSLP